jgi:hypothetical protein
VILVLVFQILIFPFGKKNIPRYWYIYIVSRYIFFTRNKDMSYYNLCGIGSQHSNISKGKEGVHIKILSRTPTTFKLEGEVTSLSESSQGEVRDNREKGI